MGGASGPMKRIIEYVARQDASLISATPVGGPEAILADLAADYGAQRISRAQFLAAQDPIHARLLLPRRRLDQLIIDPNLDVTTWECVTAETWDRLDLDQQRALVGLFVEHVVIRKGKRGRYFDPSRVQPVPVDAGAHEVVIRCPEP